MQWNTTITWMIWECNISTNAYKTVWNDSQVQHIPCLIKCNQMLQLHNHSDYEYFARKCDWYLHRHFYHLCRFYYTDKYTHTILQYINSTSHTHTWIQNPSFWAEIKSQFSKVFNFIAIFTSQN